MTEIDVLIYKCGIRFVTFINYCYHYACLASPPVLVLDDRFFAFSNTFIAAFNSSSEIIPSLFVSIIRCNIRNLCGTTHYLLSSLNRCSERIVNAAVKTIDVYMSLVPIQAIENTNTCLLNEYFKYSWVDLLN